MLTATVVGERELRQDDLFGAGERKDREQARQALLERLASRLGRDAVLQPKQQADPQPEFQCSFIPTMAARGKKAPSKKKQPKRKTPKNTSPLVGEVGPRFADWVRGERGEVNDGGGLYGGLTPHPP